MKRWRTGTDVVAARTHLDVGCGASPRNPYRCEEVFGLDIRSGLSAPGVVEIRAANVAVGPIPFDDQLFDSVSAYDFFEHIPRYDSGPGRPVFPFIHVMNEVHRVLKPGGILYAVFPAYPHSLAFCDPTHVNVLTERSYRYFCGVQPMAGMYGFEGRFDVLRQVRIHPRGDMHPRNPGVALRLKMGVDHLMGRRSHVVWEWRKA